MNDNKNTLNAANIKEMLCGTKVFVETIEKSQGIKKMLKSYGFELADSTKYRSMPFIYIGQKYVTAATDFEEFCSDSRRVVAADDILKINDVSIDKKDESQSEWKPRMFERVLVRNYQDEVWLPAFYKHGCSHVYITIEDMPYLQCIQYDGNESLAGKTGNSTNC